MRDELEIESNGLLYTKPVLVYSDLSYFQEWQGDVFQIVRNTYHASKDDEKAMYEWDNFVKSSQYITQKNIRKIWSAPALGIYDSESKYSEMKDDSLLIFKKNIFGSFNGEKKEKKGFMNKLLSNKYLFYPGCFAIGYLLASLPYISTVLDWLFKPIGFIVGLSLPASLLSFGLMLLTILLLKTSFKTNTYGVIDHLNLNASLSLKGVPSVSENYLLETVSRGFWLTVIRGDSKESVLISMRELVDTMKAPHSDLISNETELPVLYANFNLKGIYVCDSETRNRITGNLLPLNKREYFGFVTLKGLVMYTAIVLSIHLIILLLLG